MSMSILLTLYLLPSVLVVLWAERRARLREGAAAAVRTTREAGTPAVHRLPRQAAIPAPAPVEPFDALLEGLPLRDRLILRRIYVDRDPLSTIGRDLDVPPRKLRAWVDSAHSRARSRLAMSA